MSENRRDFGTIRLRGRTWWVRYKVDGKTYEDEGEARTALTREYQMKIEKFVPLWKINGVV